MVDYWLIRRERVSIAELYKLDGDYSYRSGFNPRAVVAFAVTAIPTALIALLPASPGSPRSRGPSASCWVRSSTTRSCATSPCPGRCRPAPEEQTA